MSDNTETAPQKYKDFFGSLQWKNNPDSARKQVIITTLEHYLDKNWDNAKGSVEDADVAFSSRSATGSTLEDATAGWDAAYAKLAPEAEQHYATNKGCQPKVQ